MITRRVLLSSVRSAALLPLFPRHGNAADTVLPLMPDDGKISFRAFRHDSQIGTHDLVFTREGNGFTIAIDVSFRVGIGPLTLFRYRMKSEERWNDRQFVGINSVTNHNGRSVTMSALRAGDSIAVQATGITPYKAPANALPLTHWNIDNMKNPVFNPETGKMMEETITTKGNLTLPAAISPSGGTATQYILTGDSYIEDWYDATHRWVGLKAQASDGSTITYQRA